MGSRPQSVERTDLAGTVPLPGVGWFSFHWPDLKLEVAGFAMQCYYLILGGETLHMLWRWRLSLTTIVDLGLHTVALWH
jgi:hypothetical protein